MKRLCLTCLLVIFCLSFAPVAFAATPTIATPAQKINTMPTSTPLQEGNVPLPENAMQAKESVLEYSVEPIKAEPTQAPKADKMTSTDAIVTEDGTFSKEAIDLTGIDAVEPVQKQATRIALILPNVRDDMAWSQAMYDGLQQITKAMPNEEFLLSVDDRLSNPAKASKLIQKYASEGYDIIIAHGARYQSIIEKIAPKFPKTSFVYGTGFTTAQPNVFGYDPKAQEGGYLLGMLSGFLTKSNIIGIVGSVETGRNLAFDRGFAEGVKAVNPKAQLLVTYTNGLNKFGEAGKIAKTHIVAGADILTGTAPQSIEAIKVASGFPGVLWMGSDMNPSSIAPETVAASQIYNFAYLINKILELRAQNILGNQTIPLNLANGFEVVRYNWPIRSDYMRKIDEAKQAIKEGSLYINFTQNTEAIDTIDKGKAPESKVTAPKVAKP